jgi:hypothetical protein
MIKLIERLSAKYFTRNYEKKNTWNIRRLVDQSFVPLAQWTSVLYCRLSDLRENKTNKSEPIAEKKKVEKKRKKVKERLGKWKIVLQEDWMDCTLYKKLLTTKLGIPPTTYVHFASQDTLYIFKNEDQNYCKRVFC